MYHFIRSLNRSYNTVFNIVSRSQISKIKFTCNYNIVLVVFCLVTFIIMFYDLYYGNLNISSYLLAAVLILTLSLLSLGERFELG